MQSEITASGPDAGVRGGHLLLLIGMGAMGLALLGAFAYAARGADDFPGELSISLWVQSWRTPWLDTLMKAFSAPGFKMLAIPLVGLASVVLYVKGRYKGCVLVLGAVLVSFGVNYVIREVVARPRPPSDLVVTFGDLHGSSFPSGHVMHYVVFLGVLVFIATQNLQSGAARWLVYGSFALALVAVGVSRIYLGAHWFGDVVGGYVFGAVVVAAAIAVWHQWIRKERVAAED